VYLISRIQVTEKLVGSAGNNEVAAARGFHGLNRFGIGNQRLEWERLVLSNAHHHETEGIGYGQAHRRENGGSFIFDTSIDAGADDRIGGHWIFSFELQCSSNLPIFKVAFLFSLPLFSLWRLTQADARSAAVLIDELDAGGFQRTPDSEFVGRS